MQIKIKVFNVTVNVEIDEGNVTPEQIAALYFASSETHDEMQLLKLGTRLAGEDFYKEIATVAKNI